MKLKNMLLTGALLAGLTACGGDDSPAVAGGGGTTTVTPINVAVQSNNSSVTSTFVGNETFTTDGDTATTNFWVGGAIDDSVTVSFDKVYALSKLVVYTNNTSASVTGGVVTSGIRLFLSQDGATFNEVNLALGATAGSISCSGVSFGSGIVSCDLSPSESAQHLRVQVTSDFATTNIYEIEATGV